MEEGGEKQEGTGMEDEGRRKEEGGRRKGGGVAEEVVCHLGWTI